MVIFHLLAILVWHISGADSDHLFLYFCYHLYPAFHRHLILGAL